MRGGSKLTQSGHLPSETMKTIILNIYIAFIVTLRDRYHYYYPPPHLIDVEIQAQSYYIGCSRSQTVGSDLKTDNMVLEFGG